MAIGIVAVLPGMFPASISVAPNSPRARENERIVPASTPGQASGSATERNTRHSEAPSVRAASRKRESTCSRAARAVRYISGNATTDAAITVAGHEKTTVAPSFSSSFPGGPLRPNKSSRKNPTTVGGSTSGSRQTPSTSAIAGPVRRWRHAAAARPATSVTSVATTLVSSDIQSGDQSIGELAVTWAISVTGTIGTGLYLERFFSAYNLQSLSRFLSRGPREAMCAENSAGRIRYFPNSKAVREPALARTEPRALAPFQGQGIRRERRPAAGASA